MLGMYFEQFNVIRLITSSPLWGDWTIIFSNTSVMVVLTVILAMLFFMGRKLIPNRWQVITEVIHNIIRSLVQDNLGNIGERFFPFIFCIFLFILILNVLGIFPYVFPSTAHIVVTFGMSLSIMIAVTILGIMTFGLNFFSILVPGGVPLGFVPFLVIIETLSYMIRAISLGVRLAANISAGHLLFAILSGFAFDLMSSESFILSGFPVLIIVFITLLELMVAVIQAYVFSLLTAIYLSDTLALH